MPASSKGIRAGRAYVELFADNTRLIRGLRNAAARMRSFGSQVRNIGVGLIGAGAAIVAPLLAATKHFAAAGDTVQKMADRTGFSTEALSQLGFAAEQSGASIDQLDRSLAAMARFSLQADRGLAAATDVLQELGLTIDDLSGKAPDEKFTLLAEAISRVDDPTKRAGLALAIFGRSGRELLPLLIQGRAGIEALRKEADDLGLTIGRDDADAAAELTDSMNRLWRTVKVGVFLVGAALAPAMIKGANAATTLVKRIGNWVRENRELIILTFKAGLAFLAAGVALVVFGGGIIFVGALLSGLATILTVIGTVVGALLSPWGLLIAGVIALGVWLVKSTAAGSAAIEWLKEAFAPLAREALQAFEAIKAALAAGDIEAAARVLWAGLKLQWAKGVAVLHEQWLMFRKAFTDVWAAAQTTIAKAFVHTIDFLADAWSGFVAFVQQSWQQAIRLTSNLMIDFLTLIGEVSEAEAGMMKTGIHMMTAVESQRASDRRDDDIAERERNRQQTLANIDSMADQEAGERDRDFQRRITESQAALDAARGEFSSAVGKAHDGGDNAEEGGGGIGGRFQELLDMLADADAGLAGSAAAVQSGTFSSEAGRMFVGGDNIPKQQLDVLRRIERNTDRESGDLAFAP